HDVPPIMYRKRLIIVFQKHISGEKLRCFYFIRKKVRIQQKTQKTDIENMQENSTNGSRFSKNDK
ncbi:MAG: hypothetical protein J6I95_08640, partial [Anaerotignum sp.]|nr:hypothetical protein [Anaerotignum sp.]